MPRKIGGWCPTSTAYPGRTRGVCKKPDALSKLLRAKASDAARIVLGTGSLACVGQPHTPSFQDPWLYHAEQDARSVQDKHRELLKRFGSSMVLRNARAVAGATPGTVIRRRVVSSPLASLRIWTS